MQTVGPSNILPADNLLGIRFWRQAYQSRTPRFEVFEVVGRNEGDDVYVFQSWKEGTLLVRTLAELAVDDSFRPFLIDMQKTAAFL